jgi:type I restriction enzyme S subunit
MVANAKTPDGYKKTEAGVIPEGWSIKPLIDVAPLQRGFDLPTSQIKKGNYPVVYSMEY